jgi:energy-coupling factor transporter ATP-binding protein EcfA2
MNTEADVDFRKEKLQLPQEEMKQIADKILAAFE